MRKDRRSSGKCFEFPRRQGILKVQCNIHLLIHLLSTYYVPDISLGAGDTDSSDKSSPRIKSCLLRRQSSTQTMTTHCDQCLKTSSSGSQEKRGVCDRNLRSGGGTRTKQRHAGKQLGWQKSKAAEFDWNSGRGWK